MVRRAVAVPISGGVTVDCLLHHAHLLLVTDGTDSYARPRRPPERVMPPHLRRSQRAVAAPSPRRLGVRPRLRDDSALARSDRQRRRDSWPRLGRSDGRR
jgi:hypothetical protein